MVAHNVLVKENRPYFNNVYKSDTVVDVNKCLKQIKNLNY